MPIFEYECGNCEYVWEDTILSGEPEPEFCPQCEEKEVRKLMSLPAAGKVKLYGQDFKNQMATEAKKLEQQMYRDENLLANFVGEKKYEQKTKEYEKDRQNRPKIKTNKKSSV